MLRKRPHLALPPPLGSDMNRSPVLSRQLTQRMMDPQNAINVDVHRDLVHHDGKVNELLGGQIGNLNGLRLILGVHSDHHRIGVAVQGHTRTLNLEIRRALVKQLPRLSRTIHPIVHREPTCLGKDQSLFFILGHWDLTFLLQGFSSIS